MSSLQEETSLPFMLHTGTEMPSVADAIVTCFSLLACGVNDSRCCTKPESDGPPASKLKQVAKASGSSRHSCTASRLSKVDLTSLLYALRTLLALQLL